jgi:hypothetical protein
LKSRRSGSAAPGYDARLRREGDRDQRRSTTSDRQAGDHLTTVRTQIDEGLDPIESDLYRQGGEQRFTATDRDTLGRALAVTVREHASDPDFIERTSYTRKRRAKSC